MNTLKLMAEKQGITEELKAQDQMAWVGAMNNIRNAAAEIINSELICAMLIVRNNDLSLVSIHNHQDLLTNFKDISIIISLPIEVKHQFLLVIYN